MAEVAFHQSSFLRITDHGNRNGWRFRRRTVVSPVMQKVSSPSQSLKKENSSEEIIKPLLPHHESSKPSDLRFDRKQTFDEECEIGHKRTFGRFIAREALVDEEFWTAAWLRAESHWENQAGTRYLESYKRKFSEQEFNALKRRCSGKIAEKCTCIVAVIFFLQVFVRMIWHHHRALLFYVKKEERNVKRTVLNSVVGTLDLSIRHLLHGETFPGERARVLAFSTVNKNDPQKYGYIANLCVAKYARRQGIASNMLYLAIEAAKLSGVEQVFVHVNKDNKPARLLYEKIGFQIIDTNSSDASQEHNYLMCFKD